MRFKYGPASRLITKVLIKWDRGKTTFLPWVKDAIRKTEATEIINKPCWVYLTANVPKTGKHVGWVKGTAIRRWDESGEKKYCVKLFKARKKTTHVIKLNAKLRLLTVVSVEHIKDEHMPRKPPTPATCTYRRLAERLDRAQRAFDSPKTGCEP